MAKPGPKPHGYVPRLFNLRPDQDERIKDEGPAGRASATLRLVIDYWIDTYDSFTLWVASRGKLPE